LGTRGLVAFVCFLQQFFQRVQCDTGCANPSAADP
jgi:hypothetical protein